MALPTISQMTERLGEGLADGGAELFDASVERLRGYFNSTEKVRVFVPQSPAFGHASATIAILNRFIALGFTEALEVVYSDDESTQNKLKVLLPGFNPETRADIEVMSSGKIGTISFKRYTVDELDPLPFAITGGFDEINRTPVPKNLKINWFVVLQPYLWERAENVALFGPFADRSNPLEAFVVHDLSGVGYLQVLDNGFVGIGTSLSRSSIGI